MKLHRLAASTIGVAIVAASALGLSASAVAATPGVTYVIATDIVQTNTAGDAGWTKVFPDNFSSSTSGLAVVTQNMISYGVATPILASTTNALADFAQATTFTSSDSSQFYVGITVLNGNGSDNLIFSPYAGTDSLSDPTAGWFSTNPIGTLTDSDSVLYTLAQFDHEFSTNSALAAWTVESFSLEFFSAATLYTMTVNGEHFSFLPEPVVTAAPTTVTAAALTAEGVTVTTTGFLPNEPVTFAINGGAASAAGTADSAGALSFTYRASAPAGSYTLTLVGSTSAVAQSFPFTVTAPAAVVVDGPATPVLPSTGIDSITPVLLGTGFLLGGAALTVLALKRRRTA